MPSEFDKSLKIRPTFTEKTTTFEVSVVKPGWSLLSFRVYRYDKSLKEYVPAITPGKRMRLINLKYKEDLRGTTVQIYAFIKDNSGEMLDRELVKTIRNLS